MDFLDNLGGLRHLHRRLSRLRHPARGTRADRGSEEDPRLPVRILHARGLRHHRRASRTAQVSEYYVAGRSVPAFYNGMATGADWMSAASFVGMAGTLFLLGYDGLAWVLGWTGGFVLVSILIGPYLRKFGAYTVPDFLAFRYGGNLARGLGVIVLVACSFTYVTAQIYGTGLIASRFLGMPF